jgi:AcrR family transcriptional regulator
MRNLAARLGAAPMALYCYVASKDDIFELMVDAVAADADDTPAGAETWREAMRRHAHRTRESFLRHRWLVQVPPSAQAALTPRRFAERERALTALDGLGLDADGMLAVLDTVTAYAAGASAVETTMAQLIEQGGHTSGSDLRSALGPQMTWLMSTGRFPTYQRCLAEAQHKDDALWRFDLGLDCVLDGIAARTGIHVGIPSVGTT